MAKDALERLFEDAMNSSNNTSTYSIDEQLDVDDDFLGVMSNSSKDTLLSRIQKVELDDTPFEEQQINDFNNDIKSALDYSLTNESNENKMEENISEDDLMFGKVELDNIEDDTEDTLEDTDNDSDEEDIEEEKEEPVVEQKRGRGRPRKKPVEESTSTNVSSAPSYQSSNNSTKDINSLNEFMDSLAKDLINELRESNYKTRNFNKKQMNVILDYIENKI